MFFLQWRPLALVLLVPSISEEETHHVVEHEAQVRCPMPKQVRAVTYGKVCPHGKASCLNENYGYRQLQHAWAACGQITGCAYISQFRHLYYARRDSDPAVHAHGFRSFIYDCTEAPTTPVPTPWPWDELRKDALEIRAEEREREEEEQKRMKIKEKEVEHEKEKEVEMEEELQESEEKFEKEEEAYEHGDLHESNASVAIAATLLASISFQMSLFYLLANDDADIRLAAYEVITSTVSIFCAVLLFNEANVIFVPRVQEGEVFKFDDVLRRVAHMFFWFALMQVILAIVTGSVPGMAKPESVEKAEMRLKSWGILFAHITGFAAIHACGAMQQAFFYHSPVISFLAVPMSYILLTAIAITADRGRLIVSTWESPGECDGMEIDEFEEMWDNGAEEVENDFFGLALSFTLIQAVRFAIGGNLPDVVGEELDLHAFEHTMSQVCGLLLFGILCLIIKWWGATIFCMRYVESEWFKRQVHIWLTVASMSFAWAVFYATRWALAAHAIPLFLHDTTLLCVILAILLSLISFGAMMVLDKLADMECTDDTVDRKLRDCIAVLGLLVGFAWEQTFEIAESALAARTARPDIARLFLAAFSVLILIPAWRYHLLPMAIAEGYRYGFILERVEREWGSLEELAAFVKGERQELNERRKDIEQILHEDHSITEAQRKQLVRDLLHDELHHHDDVVEMELLEQAAMSSQSMPAGRQSSYGQRSATTDAAGSVG